MVHTFKAFLSHRYKSPETNLFFFNLFTGKADVQFEVDAGVEYRPFSGGEVVKQLPTNVTRIERMVRDSNAFVGIYPLSLGPTDSPTEQQLAQDSRYFLLELDVAVRAGKPALVLFDERYGETFCCPDNIYCASFDAQEIRPGQASPRAAAFAETFTRFCDSVAASMAHAAFHGATAKSSRVGLLLPPRDAEGRGYGDDEIKRIKDALTRNALKPVPLSWPPAMGRELIMETSKLDFVVVDVGDDPVSAPAVAFLHGRAVPALRLRQRGPAVPERSALEMGLLGNLTAGYPKDVVRWQFADQLGALVEDRIQVLKLMPKLIGTREQAETYFGRTAKRPINVFLSYTGRDEEVGKRISLALKERFQKVFDYKDGKSIRPGEPWLAEIFDQLADSSVGIPLLSDEYFASGNCEHEARELIQRRDNGGLHVIPVKLKPKVTAPTWFGDTQAERLFATNGDVAALVDTIVELVDQRAKARTKPAGTPI
jgi:hypothetical protein